MGKIDKFLMVIFVALTLFNVYEFISHCVLGNQLIIGDCSMIVVSIVWLYVGIFFLGYYSDEIW
jgi:hypothetical protein